jgi:hypothetical protein
MFASHGWCPVIPLRECGDLSVANGETLFRLAAIRKVQAYKEGPSRHRSEQVECHTKFTVNAAA